MRNDPPSTLRRGYGYHQARAAGLGGIRTDRSPRQVNRLIKDAKAEREAKRILRDAAADPDWEKLIRYRASQGIDAVEIENEIYWIKRYAWAKAKGYSLSYRLKHHWPQSN